MSVPSGIDLTKPGSLLDAEAAMALKPGAVAEAAVVFPDDAFKPRPALPQFNFEEVVAGEAGVQAWVDNELSCASKRPTLSQSKNVRYKPRVKYDNGKQSRKVGLRILVEGDDFLALSKRLSENPPTSEQTRGLPVRVVEVLPGLQPQ